MFNNDNLRLGLLLGVVAGVSALIGLLVAGLFLGFGGSDQEGGPLGGEVENRKVAFVQGIWAGSPASQIVNSSAQWIGDISTSEDVEFTGALTASGDLRLASPVLTGASSTLSGATTTVSAAQVCDNGIVNHSSIDTGANGSTTLPDAGDVFSDCLTTNGDGQVSFLLRNLSSTTSTQVVAGASTTLVEPDGQNVVLGGGNSALVTLFRLSATELYAIVDEFIDAD